MRLAIRAILPLLACWMLLLLAGWPRHRPGIETPALIVMPILVFAAAGGPRKRWPFVLAGAALAGIYIAGDAVVALGPRPFASPTWTLVLSNVCRVAWLVIACAWAASGRWFVQDAFSTTPCTCELPVAVHNRCQRCGGVAASISELKLELEEFGTTCLKLLLAIFLSVLPGTQPALRPARPYHVFMATLPMILLPCLAFIAARGPRNGVPFLIVGAALGFVYAYQDVHEACSWPWGPQPAFPVLSTFLTRALILMLACRFAASARWWLQDHWPWRPPPRDVCRKCGYSLIGNVSGRCPECGTNVPAA